MAAGERKCFVIMPFGRKVDADGTVIDFDQVYANLYVEPAEALGLTIVRCDHIAHAGSIHEDMFSHIAMDDVVLVDISLANANVYYELGVRHALKPSVTVLTKHSGTVVPFNIQGQRIIEYPADAAGWAGTRRQIKEYIENGLDENQTDSPIFTILQDARKDWTRERIQKRTEHAYRLRHRTGSRAGISVITGDLREWPGIDVWVNSENTNMQMARYFDRSLSAMVRYEGALKDDNGEVVEDTIALGLAAAVNGREVVSPGTVYVTTAGSLEQTRGVRNIFHAATAQGVPGSGYQVMQDVEKCVTACLRRMDHLNHAGHDLRSIVFPMLGTGEGGGDVNVIADRLVRTAVGHLCANPGSRVEKVYFSAWNRRDLDACRAALRAGADVEPV